MIIQTNDNHKIQVSADDVRPSKLLDMIAKGMGEEEEEVPLYNVSHNVFLKVLEFMRHYNTEPMRPIPKPLPDDGGLRVQPWYASYIETLGKDNALYDVLNAANYLDIGPLQDLACAQVASIIRGKDCHEMKQIFGLDYDNL